MLVVVYLISSKKYVIIPQEWIMTLTQEALNNHGKASYQNRRIYWSNVGVNCDGIPDTSIVPDFNRNISSTFPPDGDDACYIARIKCFCATLNRAKYFRDTFRPQLPVLYNARRLFEVPLPSLPATNQNTNHPNRIDDREPNDILGEVGSELDPIADQLSEHNADLNDNLDVLYDEEGTEVQDSFVESSQANSKSNSDDEIKYNMPNIVLDETDSSAVASFFNYEHMDDEEQNTIATTNNEEKNTDASTTVATNETIFSEDGVLKIKKIIDDDCEMIFEFGANIKPHVGFDVKVNDPVSMNIPFKENVS